MTRFTRLVGGLALAAALAAPLATSASAQTADNNQQILQGLSSVTNDDPSLTVELLRKMAQDAVAQNQPLGLNKSAIAQKLDKLAQITVQIQFALNSSIIRPESYGTLGSIADAMHHPILWNYKFVVVGNTDATGTRAYNLKLSQERADAIVQALVTLFRVSPDRLQALGLGQEALQVPGKPDDPINRRVQIFNIGTMGPMGKAWMNPQ
ncbi:outer membrane protein OmpA-like peptidoglycan-associated protein [Angulomicrobium tetraedrale]|uniref:Outer membrane protein OmpA-like peptidoglycan-associated protein n=1 Tax=Ancylobacter tetraedralis TaxID=217068 RepID=A0A839ZHF0_9HYPH|nr:OmpA family protein [Ancylobacter tetraedralis]MBB3773965.1 outer membrane protein OmpA-like peptidoglycan-associated protein [Ancylobacter tetraedralis]